MKIAYVTQTRPGDIRAWSGTIHYMQKALAEAGAQVAHVGGLHTPSHRAYKALRLAWRLLGKTYLIDRQKRVLRSWASQVEAALQHTPHDVVFTPSSLLVPHLRTTKPVVVWTDASFGQMLNYYVSENSTHGPSLRLGHETERAALSRASLIIYSTEWAARGTVELYGTDAASKIRVVPFGANLNIEAQPLNLQTVLTRRPASVCRLLWVGVEWERKGGALALKVAAELNASGLRTELHLAGCKPPGTVPDYVKVHGFLSKNQPEQAARLSELYHNSHFMILPTRAECSAIVFSEACAHALPTLTTRTGGVPECIREGLGGHTFESPDDPAPYAACVRRLMANPGDYEALVASSHREFTERLNWGTSGARVLSLIRELT